MPLATESVSVQIDLKGLRKYNRFYLKNFDFNKNIEFKIFLTIVTIFFLKKIDEGENFSLLKNIKGQNIHRANFNLGANVLHSR